jgi:hypothetical protein
MGFYEYYSFGPNFCAGVGCGGLQNTSYQSTNGRLNAANEAVGFKFWPTSTSPITHVCFWCDISGTMTGITYAARIETNSGDAPSGSVLGAATAAIAAPAADGWVAETALGTATGNLTLNTPYWLIIADGGGTAPDTSNYTVFGLNNSPASFGGRARHHNGTNWTTTTAGSGDGIMYVKHQDGTYDGIVTATGTGTKSAAATISGTTRMGMRGQFAQAQKISTFACKLDKATSPSDLDITLYIGDTLTETVTRAAAEIIANQWVSVVFSEVTIPAATYFYVMLHQNSDGGDGSNNYSVYASTFVTSTSSLWKLVYGTSETPSSLTVSTTEWPTAFVGGNGLSGAGGAVPAAGFNTGFN